jgi:uncharacterized protein (DUF736 family)
LIDVVIPTIPERKESLERLVRSLARTVSIKGKGGPALHVIENSPTCGAGWREGLEQLQGDYVLLACDDQEFLTPGWDALCRRTVDEGALPCPRIWGPDGSIESQGGDMAEPHHTIRRPQRDGTPVDYTTIPFLSRVWAEAIGMGDWHYCTDVWVSYRGRQLGLETVLRHGFDVRHHWEMAGRGAGYSQGERDAMDEAAMRKELERCASL